MFRWQLYQPRKSQVILKSVLRKKRSFKRSASQVGRGKGKGKGKSISIGKGKGKGKGKQQPLLKAIAAERDALQQKNNVHKMQEAKAAANKYEGVATQKRLRAQMLMENADLATYKAMMALKIAEAAQVDEAAPERVASLFLG